jgi:hypothetical protein
MKVFDCSASKEIDFSFLHESPLKKICFPKIEIIPAGDAIPLNEYIDKPGLDPLTNEDDFFADGRIPMITVDHSQLKAKWTTQP